MAEVIEATRNKTRDLPINSKLRELLLAAAAATAIDTVLVTSGGQCRKGTCTKRKGSTRHDDGQAADLKLLIAGKAQSFTDANGLEHLKAFVTEAARLGATGLGAGINYMGADTIHVGFGKRAVWGANGRSENAPAWLLEAAREGWGVKPHLWLEQSLDSDDEEEETDHDSEPDEAVSA